MTCSACGDVPTYSTEAELPDYQLPAFDSAGLPIDYESGWSFVARIGQEGRPAVFTTTSVVGYDGGVVISFDEGDLASIGAGVWLVHVVATQLSDGRDRDVFGQIRIRLPVLPAA